MVNYFNDIKIEINSLTYVSEKDGDTESFGIDSNVGRKCVLSH